jgi:hypothetical protein
MTHHLVVNIHHDEQYDVYVGRPSKWGNPFSLPPRPTGRQRAACLRKYRAYVAERPDLQLAAKLELKGKVLGCFCAPKPCHADVLAEIANDDN